MTGKKITWVGSSIQNFDITEELSDGPYSTIYLGQSTKDKTKQVFKVAKFDGEIGTGGMITGFFATEARATVLGGTRTVLPNPEKLLSVQYDELKSLQQSGLVKVIDFVQRDGICFYTMEHLEGQSLRQVLIKHQLTNSQLPHKQLIALSQLLHRLSVSASYKYHGDIKPENIMLTPEGPIFIDPGYFGVISTTDTMLQNCAITTPHYYPRLIADDLFAFGCILWEALVGRHPLQVRSDDDKRDATLIGPKLAKIVSDEEMVGKYFLSPILNIKLPCALRPDLSIEDETFLLKALRLKLTGPQNTILESAAGYSDFYAIAEGLAALEARDKSA